MGWKKTVLFFRGYYGAYRTRRRFRDFIFTTKAQDLLANQTDGASYERYSKANQNEAVRIILYLREKYQNFYLCVEILSFCKAGPGKYN